MSALTQSPAWTALSAHARARADITLAELFKADPARAERFTVQSDPLYLDYSRQPITPETLTLLRAWLEQSEFNTWRDRLFAGEHINTSEDRAVLHSALRDADGTTLELDGVDVLANIRASREQMLAFAEAVRAGTITGSSGLRITDIVHIGIGGSDLGPRLVCEALCAPAARPALHFVSNLDAADMEEALTGLNPATTLVIISSKTFTTAETLANAHAARDWMAAALGAEAAAQHCCAVTANPARAVAWGVAEARIFPYWDFVGGRFSLWSSVGLPIALALGSDAFLQLLQGAAAMDRHFRSAAPEQNLPVTAALLEAWQRNFLGTTSRAVFPYAHRLKQLPAYLQQLEMESLGKTVDRDGAPVDYATAPVVWGGTGTIAQHSVFQWLQQGSDKAMVEFVAIANAAANKTALEVSAFVLGQVEGLAQGASFSGQPHAAFRGCAGDRASTLVILDSLGPNALGALLAFYEHKVFTLGVLWRLNPFDQWGVELGKVLAKDWVQQLESGKVTLPAARRLLGQ